MSEAVWAAFRRTVELGDQLEASLDVPAKEGPRNAMTAPTTTATGRPSPGDPGGRRAPSTCVAPSVTCGRTRPPSGIASSRPGPASTTLPGTSRVRRRRTRAGPTGRSPSTSATSPTGRSSPPTTSPVAIGTGRWPSDDDYDGGDFDRYNERRRAPWTTMSAEAILARLTAARPRAAGGRAAPHARDDPRPRGVGLGLLRPAWPLSRPPRGHRAVDRRPPAPPGRWRPVRRRSAGARPSWLPRPGGGDRGPVRRARPDGPAAALERRGHPGLDPQGSRRPSRRLGDGGRPRHRGLPRQRHLAGRSGRRHRRLE